MNNPLDLPVSEKANAGLMIDLENLHYSAYQFYKDRQFSLTILLNYLTQRFNLILKKAYACSFDDSMQPYIHDCMLNGIDLVNCLPTRMHDTRKKNSIDIRMAVDVVSRVHTDPNINIYIIASGDGDFVPVISHVRQFANKVIIVGFRESTSVVLIANCDEFIEIDQLLEQAPRTPPRANYRSEKIDRESYRRENPRQDNKHIRTHRLNKDEIKSALESTFESVKDQLVFGITLVDFQTILIKQFPSFEQTLKHISIEKLIKSNSTTLKMKEENGDTYLFLDLVEPTPIQTIQPLKSSRRTKKSKKQNVDPVLQNVQLTSATQSIQGSNKYQQFWEQLPSKKERIRFFNHVFSAIEDGNKLNLSKLKQIVVNGKSAKIKAIQLQLYEALFLTRAIFSKNQQFQLKDWIRDTISLEEHFVSFWIVFFKLDKKLDFDIDEYSNRLEVTTGITPMQRAALLEPTIFLLRLGLRSLNELLDEKIDIL